MHEQAISSGFPFKSNYIAVENSRLHYIDEGQGDPVLFLHGNPTSSYLWRNIIPYLTPYARCIAVDLIGFGKSGKPDIGYRIADHYRYVEGFIEKLKLENITMVLHDWGSALGLNYASLHENNIKGIAFMEAILKTFTWEDFPGGFRTGFRMFRAPVVGWLMIGWLNVFIEKILPGATVRRLSDKEMEAYREPFAARRDRKPVWVFPNEIPVNGKPADVAGLVNRYSRWLQESGLPKLLFFASPGGIIGKKGVDWCRRSLKSLKTVDTGRGIHYLQEDNPHLIGPELAKWYQEISS